MVFQQEGQSLESWYPESLTKIFGTRNLGSLHGNLHKFLKNMILTIVSPESLKKMFSDIESVATKNMKEWASKETVEMKTAVADMIFELMGKKLISYDQEKSSENLRENFGAFIKGLITFPLDIPGTAFHKCLQTTSQAITVAIKLLSDNPRALKELTEEHEKIQRNRENPEFGLTWQEYKSMTFTFQGMDFKCASKTFMAFGGGLRFCVGADFARVQMAVFLHFLVTKYQWQLVKGGETERTPGLQFPNGFHVNFFEKDKHKDPMSV
uniref:Cytochrome P450 87A3 n=1 Tax=Tanacetum cinerariifolium TaxID=118510 RepID=A0A6L2P3Y2_TANCI|nr:cytochrome P450 87A3 [Tanacetum cinerariifolium]